MFITAAYADGPASGFDPMSMLPFVGIFVVFYFLILRPQSKKAKAHKEMLDAIRRGDRIVTTGGLIGLVRISQGGHFLSDVVFSLIAIWGAHLLIRAVWLRIRYWQFQKANILVSELQRSL